MSVGQLKTVLEFDPDHSCPRKLEIIVQMIIVQVGDHC